MQAPLHGIRIRRRGGQRKPSPKEDRGRKGTSHRSFRHWPCDRRRTPRHVATVRRATPVPRRGRFRANWRGNERKSKPGGSAEESDTWTKRTATAPSWRCVLFRIRSPVTPPYVPGNRHVDAAFGPILGPEPSSPWSAKERAMKVYAHAKDRGFVVATPNVTVAGGRIRFSCRSPRRRAARGVARTALRSCG